jgi:glycosyltransferase involved in cell wall biosynthesis
MATLNVLVITYNHAPFIGRCLDGILSQQTDHTIRINVVEDCSTDGTQDVIRDYVARYPDRITAVLNPVNIGRTQGIQQQVWNGFRSLKGDYIALIEGDDYWSDPTKVQRQLDTLERNPTYVASAHNVVKVYEDGDRPSHRFIYSEDGRDTYQIDDLVRMTKFFHISTLIFRNVHPDREPACFKYVKSKWCCDIYFNMMFTQFGQIHYTWRDLSIYRAHSGGNFSGLSDVAGRIFNIEGLMRYNWWLRFRFFKGFSFTIHRLTREMLKLSDMGQLPPLTRRQRLKYGLISKIYAKLYDLVDAHPRLDPAVWLHGQAPKASLPRLKQLVDYDRAYERGL